ncbi:MAG: hypothetical protein MSJ26_06140 [Oscillospiraceae bacterium]|nr:hypothetical protein [Oscillospiraceae bacterium]
MPKGQPNKMYTPELKIKVVETIHKEHKSYRETARDFEKSKNDIVAKLERNYLEEGKKGL